MVLSAGKAGIFVMMLSAGKAGFFVMMLSAGKAGFFCHDAVGREGRQFAGLFSYRS